MRATRLVIDPTRACDDRHSYHCAVREQQSRTTGAEVCRNPRGWTEEWAPVIMGLFQASQGISSMIAEEFIRRWDEAVTSDLDGQLPDNVPPYIAEHRSVLRPAASRREIEAAERRLGTKLPPSYKAFLSVTNGAYANATGMVFGSGWKADGTLHEQGIGLLPAEALTPEPPEFAPEWASAGLEGVVDPNYRTDISEWEYLDYRLEQDPISFKTGHYRHCFIVSSNHDGSEVLLNPCVRQPDGEWEAWDFGSKLPGAYRYRSFEALLQHHIDQPPDLSGTPPPFDVEAALSTLGMPGATDRERSEAIHQLWLSGLDSDEHPRYREEALKLALDQSADRYLRGSEARDLAMKVVVDELLLLLHDPEDLVWSAAVPALVYSGDLRAREAVLPVLSQPDLDSSVVRRLWLRDPSGVVWEAYRNSGNLDLLAFCTRIGQHGAQGEMVRKLADPEISSVQREELAGSVWGPQLDPETAAGLVTAAQLPGAPLTEIGTLLTSIDPDAAVPIWRRVVHDADNRADASIAAMHLKTIGTPEALDVLIESLDTELPNPGAIIVALSGFSEPSAVDAIASFLPDEDQLLTVIYAQEAQAIPEARDVLISLDHIQARRALARLGHSRAIHPLLGASRSEDDELRREALEGLRELSHPSTVDRLVEVLEAVRPDSDEAAICAHTLAMMRAPTVIQPLNNMLARSDNLHLHNVITDWLDQLKR